MFDLEENEKYRIISTALFFSLIIASLLFVVHEASESGVPEGWNKKYKVGDEILNTEISTSDYPANNLPMSKAFISFRESKYDENWKITTKGLQERGFEAKFGIRMLVRVN